VRRGPGHVLWLHVAEPFQQQRRAGHAQISQQPAPRKRGAPEGAAHVGLLRAVVEVPRCQASLEVHVFEKVIQEFP
jgi:hypothetical protein